MKSFLDKNVIPLLKGDDELPRLELRGEIHSPPTNWDTICVYLVAETGSWVPHVYRLLKTKEFMWDYMREPVEVSEGGVSTVAFGGDGMPFIHESGLVSCRLCKKVDGITLIIELGSPMSNKISSGAEVKALFDMFKKKDDLNFHQVATQFTPPFGRE